MLAVKDLHKTYSQREHKIPVLRGVSLEAKEGESIAILGSSGVGKSTLLHILGLLDTQDRGEIWLDQRLISEANAKERAQIRLDSIGFVFQFHYLMAELTALENVSVPGMIQGTHNTEDSRHWLERVGLKERLHHRPSELSGGEQQRVAIARALVGKPKIIFADEPTGNLDTETAQTVFGILKEQCSSLGSILIMATHNRDLAAQMDRVLSLKEGELRA